MKLRVGDLPSPPIHIFDGWPYLAQWFFRCVNRLYDIVVKAQGHTYFNPIDNL